MVRNFGERRKKSKHGGQPKKSKSRKPNTNTPLQANKGYEGIPQEEVTCREVAIYVPRPGQVDEEPIEELFDNKRKRNTSKVKKNNSYRSKREQRHNKNRSRREARNVYYDNYDDDDDEDYDMADILARMMVGAMGGRYGYITMEIGSYAGMSINVRVPLAMMMQGMRL